MKKEVSKKELANIIGRSPAIITRLVKKGFLDGCFTPSGKIIAYKAIEAIKKHKGSDYLKEDKKTTNVLSQLEIIEKIELEKNVSFTRPSNTSHISIDKLNSGAFYNWLPEIIIDIEDIKAHTIHSFNDRTIQKAIKEVDNSGKYNAMYELLDSILRDDNISMETLINIYKIMLESYYSAEAIAFYMDEILVE